MKSSKPDTSNAAPVTKPDDPCASASGTHPSVPLPRMYVDIEDDKKQSIRVRAVVDTASTRNLITHELAKSLSVPIKPSAVQISSINSTPLKVHGEVVLNVSRLDKPTIRLPQTTTELMVVDNLDAVRADIVLGLHLISAVNGVDVQYEGTQLKSIVFGGRDSACSTSDAAIDKHPYSHVEVTRNGDDVTLTTSDGSVRWDSQRGYWELTWALMVSRIAQSVLGSVSIPGVS